MLKKRGRKRSAAGHQDSQQPQSKVAKKQATKTKEPLQECQVEAKLKPTENNQEVIQSHASLSSVVPRRSENRMMAFPASVTRDDASFTSPHGGTSTCYYSPNGSICSQTAIVTWGPISPVFTLPSVQKQDRAKQKSKLTKRGNYKSRRALNEGQNAQQFLESLTEALNSMGKENQGLEGAVILECDEQCEEDEFFNQSNVLTELLNASSSSLDELLSNQSVKTEAVITSCTSTNKLPQHDHCYNQPHANVTDKDVKCTEETAPPLVGKEALPTSLVLTPFNSTRNCLSFPTSEATQPKCPERINDKDEFDFWSEAVNVLTTQEASGFGEVTNSAVSSVASPEISHDEFDMILSQVDERQLFNYSTN